MKISRLIFALLILNAMYLVGLAASELVDKDCIDLYSFDDYFNIPKNADNWNISDSNFHTGGKSFQSTGQTKSEYSIEVTGPASISYWWDSNRGDSDFFFYQMDQGPILPYTGNGWQRVSPDPIPEGKHTLKWIFSKRRNENTFGWIDDLSILRSTCNQEPSEIKSNISKSISSTGSQKEPDVNMEDVKLIQGDILDNISNINKKIDEIACQNDTVYVKKFYVNPNNYTFSSINEAISHVRPYGTIEVDSGEYDEQISIKKPLRLKGINKECTIIQSHKTVIYLNSSYVQIDGFTIIGGGFSKYGIIQMHSSNCLINNNNIKNCIQGIALSLSNNSTIYENNITNCKNGIFIENSSDNNISLNKMIVNKEGRIGLCLKNSIINLINNNEISGFEDGIKLGGICTGNFFADTNVFNNIVSCDIYIENENIFNNNTFLGEYNITKENGHIKLFKEKVKL